MIEYSDLIIESLIKAASTQAVKHGFDAISSGLRAVFERGNRQEIKSYIKSQNLIEPVAKLAQETIESSYILPFQSLAEAKPQHKVEFFSQIVKFGFDLSKQLNMDVLLPGSFISADTISLFSIQGGYPHIKVQTLAVTIGGYTDPGALSILPGGDDALRTCDEYKNAARRARQEDDGYLHLKNLRQNGNREFRVGKISAGSAYYDLPSILKPAERKELGFESNEAALPLRDWSDGIRKMLDYAADLPNIEVLPPEEGVKLMELAEELKKFYQKQSTSK